MLISKSQDPRHHVKQNVSSTITGLRKEPGRMFFIHKQNKRKNSLLLINSEILLTGSSQVVWYKNTHCIYKPEHY